MFVSTAHTIKQLVNGGKSNILPPLEAYQEHRLENTEGLEPSNCSLYINPSYQQLLKLCHLFSS